MRRAPAAERLAELGFSPRCGRQEPPFPLGVTRGWGGWPIQKRREGARPVPFSERSQEDGRGQAARTSGTWWRIRTRLQLCQQQQQQPGPGTLEPSQPSCPAVAGLEPPVKLKELHFSNMKTVDCVERKGKYMYFTVVMAEGKEIDFRCPQDQGWNAEITLQMVQYKNRQAILAVKSTRQKQQHLVQQQQPPQPQIQSQPQPQPQPQPKPQAPQLHGYSHPHPHPHPHQHPHPHPLPHQHQPPHSQPLSQSHGHRLLRSTSNSA
ncbi:pleckstrin homology-like domain family A member 1 [Fukomys damarensis]|uniref:pleckstrin homology-like domain family A member 1 n=1 Tax=Fukomys damarensis TaxID=885580 RepID=UPI00053FD696|nr:pleckstrin homology-like domain family A member 1 [Fukomys damarensis]